VQLFKVSFVTNDISEAFLLPEFRMCGGFDASVSAPVHMPEAPMHEYYLSATCEYEVRVAGQVFAMQGITITHSVNH
jgi:hypothetical protein